MKKQNDFNSPADELENITIKVCKNGKTRSEIAKASNRKGKAGERKITSILSKISGMTFIRIPNSGAQLGKSNRERISELHEIQISALLGDIFAPDEFKYRFIIESKNYQSISWKQLQKGECPSKLKGWINEINYDTETYLMSKYKRLPIPFLGFNITGKNKKGEGLWICYNKEYFEKINVNNFNPKFNIQLKNDLKLLNDIGFGENYFIEDFEQFCINNKNTMFELAT